MQFIKTRDVKSPVRDVNENAGIDFYIPENTEEFRADFSAKNKDVYFAESADLSFGTSVARARHKILFSTSGLIAIPPHKAIIIPTGIRSKFSPNMALIANNKSGIATKKQLIFGASVIDASYQGEWHINLINTSDEYQTLECGTKAVQFIPHLISTEEVEIVDQTPEEFYKDSVSSRGEGWAGSTGLK